MKIEEAAEFLEMLRENDGEATEEMRRIIATSGVWKEVAEGSLDGAIAVAMVKVLPMDIIEKLSQHENEEVRMGIALRGDLAQYKSAHARLLNDRVRRIRITADKNPKHLDE